MTGERLTESVTLHVGDSRHVLAAASGGFSAVITDPPYGTGGYTARKRGTGGASGGKAKVRHDWDVWSTDWLADAFRVAPVVAVFTPEAETASMWLAMAAFCRPVRMLLWLKPDPMPTFDKRPGFASEAILVAGPLQPAGGPNYFTASTPRARRDREHVGHPYQKPLSLMRWLVRLTTPPGGTVLDCFAGSGTTGKACEAEGRQCVLIEQEEHYAEIIRRRIQPRRAELFA